MSNVFTAFQSAIEGNRNTSLSRQEKMNGWRRVLNAIRHEENAGRVSACRATRLGEFYWDARAQLETLARTAP